MQPIQAGTVADRLRNFLKLSGRIPVAMDENVVPTTMVQDLGGPPWRTQDSDFATLVSTSAAVAARNSFYMVRMPAGASGVAIVHRALIRNSSGAIAEYSVIVASNVENEATFANFTVADRALDTERLDLTPATSFRRIPADICTADGSSLAVGYEIARVIIPVAESKAIDFRVSLRGAYQNGVKQSQAVAVVARTVNTSLTCSLYGQYYPAAL